MQQRLLRNRQRYLPTINNTTRANRKRGDAGEAPPRLGLRVCWGDGVTARAGENGNSSARTVGPVVAPLVAQEAWKQADNEQRFPECRDHWRGGLSPHRGECRRGSRSRQRGRGVLCAPVADGCATQPQRWRHRSTVAGHRSADARQNFMLLPSTILSVLRASAGTAVSSVA